MNGFELNELLSGAILFGVGGIWYQLGSLKEALHRLDRRSDKQDARVANLEGRVLKLEQAK